MAALNSILDGSDVAACIVDAQARLGMTWLNVSSILPEDGRLEEDIIDPPGPLRFQWQDKLSLDCQWAATEECHLLEFWQDDAPFHLFNIAIWFERLYIFDRQLNPVTVEQLLGWRNCFKAAAIPWLATCA